MADFLTFDELRDLGQRFSRTLVQKSESTTVRGSTFLSYSSKDSEHLPTIIGVLENHGTKVYVDKKDPTLPPTTSKETAEILRQNIGLASKFVLFVTTNSKDSTWIPWELGLADGEKTKFKVALFPAAQSANEQKWAEQEYLGLYDKIVWGQIKGHPKPEFIVLNYSANTASTLTDWLSR